MKNQWIRFWLDVSFILALVATSYFVENILTTILWWGALIAYAWYKDEIRTFLKL